MTDTATDSYSSFTVTDLESTRRAGKRSWIRRARLSPGNSNCPSAPIGADGSSRIFPVRTSSPRASRVSSTAAQGSR